MMECRGTVVRVLPLIAVVALVSIAASFALGPPEMRASNFGSISGSVASEPIPGEGSVHVNSDNQFCGDSLPSQAHVVNADGDLRYAVVYLDGLRYDGELRPSELVIDNQKCAFIPHVQAGVSGGSLVVTNADPILHNTHLFLRMGSRKRSLLNLALPNAGIRLDGSRALRSPGVVEVKCDAHAWMSAYVVLFDHPYFAVTDEEGQFEIRDVPPGTYTLKVWHETMGELDQEIVVKAGEAAVHSFKFTP